eukprot:TRINITY_DN63142_c0_g1_i1.p1 TRINITY_DN63142_c0_g1~~TRINITY_DN63142_c0_g1_i1.p1  ORF type:complete len:707 (-),score=261.30 TRINITY_DN63142_c0_g1_i1:77-2197(-)
MAMSRMLLTATGALAVASAAEMKQSSGRAAANPIRKVVTMLQAVKKKVEKEGEAEEELYKKYMCYCKSSGGDLKKSVADAEAKIPEVSSAIKEASAKRQQLDDDLVSHKTDRKNAKAALAEATALREKTAAAFADSKAESEANIGAIGKAVKALEKGMGGAFVQTSAADVLRRVVQSRDEMTESDRQDVMAFLSTEQGSPQSGQITGILKQMGDEMSKDLSDATAEETDSIKAYEDLSAAKKKEINALTKSIEEKTVRVGELAVGLADMKNDLEDTEDALAEDKKFLADLEKNCDTKSAEWEKIVKTRSEELLALADTIKLLNDDDALDLFKKTLPSASSFLQLKVTSASMKARALEVIRDAQRQQPKRKQLAFIALALEGKKVGFDKVTSMIDDMITLLKKEQKDDDDKKAYCAAEFDATDDQRKALERSISDSDKAIDNAKEGIAALVGEIQTLSDGIRALDRSVAEATEQRKSENADFKELMAQDSAAKELIGIAKNRLNKFYNPKLYAPPPKRELSEEDQIVSNFGGSLAPTPAPGGIAGTGVTVLAQVSEHSQEREAPPPAPEAPGAYSKKSEETNGVLAMMDLLVKDLDKEMTEASTAEKDAQADYEQAMKDAAEKRASDAKSLSDKQASKADGEAALQGHKDDKASTQKELAGLAETIAALHGDCDWLLQYFDDRKQARAGEVDSLSNAKAVLSGADYA